MRNSNNYTRQNGNVLFFILIAVGLFGALTYAVSNGMRGGGDTITDEQAKIGAGKVLQSMQDIRDGYAYLMSEGCSIDDINFTHPATTPYDCDIFHPNGAGISYPDNLEQYQNTPLPAAHVGQTGIYAWVTPSRWAGNTHYRVIDMGTDAQDIMIHFSFIRDDICLAVNDLLGYDFTSIPHDDDGSASSAPLKGDVISELKGKIAACSSQIVPGISAPQNQIWYVVAEF